MRRILVALVVFFIAGVHGLAYANPECYQSIPVTGYYIPLFTDFDTQKTQQVYVDGVPHRYNASFLAHALIKEKGVTLSGDIIIYEDGEWSVDDFSLSDDEKRWFPSEADYVTTRTITTFEDKKTRTYPKAFLDAAGEQGWGQVAIGQYIGKPLDCAPRDGSASYLSAQCSAQWHFDTKPLDAQGRRLAIGVVATSKKYFNPTYPWKVTIDPQPAGFLSNIFEARDIDTGSNVNIFCGSGLKGLTCTTKVTNNTSKVCFTKSSLD